MNVARQQVGVRVGACVALAITLAGCGSSSLANSGAASYVGQASNAEVFIQWTRAGDSVSGSLQEALRKESGGVVSSSRAFTGTIDGNGLTLTLNEGLGSTKALVGQMSAGGFSMTFPGAEQRLITITFVPGQVADYNHTVSELEGRGEQGATGGEEPPSTTATETTGGFATDVEQCGKVEHSGAILMVTSEDNVGCPEALGVFRDFFAGRGEHHQGADAAETYTSVDGWGCGSGAGGFGCRRNGVSITAQVSS